MSSTQNTTGLFFPSILLFPLGGDNLESSPSLKALLDSEDDVTGVFTCTGISYHKETGQSFRFCRRIDA